MSDAHLQVIISNSTVSVWKLYAYVCSIMTMSLFQLSQISLQCKEGFVLKYCKKCTNEMHMCVIWCCDITQAARKLAITEVDLERAEARLEAAEA